MCALCGFKNVFTRFAAFGCKVKDLRAETIYHACELGTKNRARELAQWLRVLSVQSLRQEFRFQGPCIKPTIPSQSLRDVTFSFGPHVHRYMHPSPPPPPHTHTHACTHKYTLKRSGKAVLIHFSVQLYELQSQVGRKKACSGLNITF